MKKAVVYCLYPGVVALDVSGPLEVFSAASQLLAGRGHIGEGYEPFCAALRPGPVRTSSGMTLMADVSFEDVTPEILLIPGNPDVESACLNDAFMTAVGKAMGRACRIMSVCSGAFILAAKGILDGKRAATHWIMAERLAELYPAIQVESDAIFVRDGNIATSGGVTAGIDLALALVEEDYGPELAMEVARLLLLYRRRPGSQSQFSAPLAAQMEAGARFSALTAWMEEHLCDNLTVDRLAEAAHMSTRSFARIFPSETGLSPARFVERLRIDRARELIESGMESLEAVARQSGFGREERLRRAFVRRLGLTPARYRAHFIRGEKHE